MSKLIVEIPSEFHKALKSLAAQTGKSMKNLVLEILEPVVHQKASPLEPLGKSLCGSWKDDRSAAEIMKDLREHRRSRSAPPSLA